MKMKHAVVIIAALVELVGVIVAAIIGVAWGKSNVTVIVQLDGKNIILNDKDVQEMASENEKLRNQISDYESQIEDLGNESKDLAVKLGAANGELSEIPVIELHNCGLSINGEEKAIDKDKSYAIINGRQYYSRDFIDTLLPENMTTTMKNEMLYIGRIIKDKTSLLDLPKVKDTGWEKWDSIIDTFGNTYSNVLFLRDAGWGITYNAGGEYSNFKCVVAMKEDSGGRGYLQIETDDESYTYISPEITNMTKKVEVDIPINYTSTITIKCVNGDYRCNIFVADAVLYNQE